MKYSCPSCGYKDVLEAFYDADTDFEREVELDEVTLATCPGCDDVFDDHHLEEHYGWFS